jgi:SOS-response transcriptional repressor LexA
MHDDLQTLANSNQRTYLLPVAGHHYADQGLIDGDIAVVDRALQARPSDLIIAWRPTGSTILKQHQLTSEDQPWGVITGLIRHLRP